MNEVKDISILETQLVALKWFRFAQNNSGGYWTENDDVQADVFVQAPNAEMARTIMRNIAKPYTEYCPCCGDRWSIEYVDDGDGIEVPSILGESILDGYERFLGGKAILHSWYGRKAIFDGENFVEV